MLFYVAFQFHVFVAVLNFPVDNWGLAVIFCRFMEKKVVCFQGFAVFLSRLLAGSKLNVSLGHHDWGENKLSQFLVLNNICWLSPSTLGRVKLPMSYEFINPNDAWALDFLQFEWGLHTLYITVEECISIIGKPFMSITIFGLTRPWVALHLISVILGLKSISKSKSSDLKSS